MTNHPIHNTKKREICHRCCRPNPKACICAALPLHPHQLQNTRVIVLQHPKEIKRKNRSLPLIELSLQCGGLKNDFCESSTSACEIEDFAFHTIIARRWGEQVVDPTVWKIVHNSDEPLLLCFPSEDAVPIEEEFERISLERKNRPLKNQTALKSSVNGKINIIFLDGTWKYAKEMDSKTNLNGDWPKHTRRVKISNFRDDFKRRRFDIRTPPSDDHLSTAECIAEVLRITEENGTELYDMLMRPLDLMVLQWNSFIKGNNSSPVNT